MSTRHCWGPMGVAVGIGRCLVLIVPLIGMLMSLDVHAATAKEKKAKRAGQQPTAPSAEPVVPHIAYLFPAGGQCGSTVKVTVGGQGLTRPQSVWIDGQGITAGIDKAVDDKKLKISVIIAAEALPGERDLRVVTAGGVSNRIRFIVGRIPEVIEAEPNSKMTQAQRLPRLPVVVNGQVLEADADLYRFQAKADQQLVLRVQARALIPFIADAVPGWIQPTLILRDAVGKELAYADDFRFDPDPVLLFQVPRDGEYVLEIKDALYRGRDDFVYRLIIGELPFITAIYPLGARRDGPCHIELSGCNLANKSLNFRLPGDCPDRWPISLDVGKLLSNTVSLAVGELPEVNESEPNNTQDKACELKVPVTVNGRISRPGDCDFFTFTGQPEQELVFEVYARRLGSPLDSMMAILNSKGTVLAQNDDTVDPMDPMITHHADSRLLWRCRSAGKYAVRIMDTQGKGGKEYAYRLTIGPLRPDFAVRIMPDNSRIASGDTAVLMAEVIRKGGFQGDVRLSWPGMPVGWTLHGASIPSGESQVRFTLTAPSDAKPDLISPKFVGTANLAGKSITRDAWPAEEVMQAFIYQHRLATRESVLAVIKGRFFTLGVVKPAGEQVIELSQGGETQLTVRVARQPDFDGPIRLSLDAPPKGINIKAVTIPPKESETTVTVVAGPMVSPGLNQNLIMAGVARIGKGVINRYVPAIPIRIVNRSATQTAR